MTDWNGIAEAYIEVWNETDPATRRTKIEKHWADGATYTDPLAAVEGHDGIDAVVGAVQAQFAGLAFTLRGPVDGHHDQARFGWSLGPAEAESLVDGFDVVTLDADGRLKDVLGFLDKVPAS